jgi:hypothetical protein
MFLHDFLIAWCKVVLDSLDCLEVGLIFRIVETLDCLDQVVICIDDGTCMRDCWLCEIFVFKEHCVCDLLSFGGFDKYNMAPVVFGRRL